MRISVLFLLVLLTAQSVYAQDYGALPNTNGTLLYDLKAALERGLNASPDVQAYEAELEASYSESKEVRANLLPQAFASAGVNRIENAGKLETNSDYVTQDSSTIRIGVEQKLFDAPSYFRYKSAGLRAEYASLSLEKKKMDTVLSIQKEFFLYFKAKEDANSYAKSIERLEKHLEAAEAFYKRHMAPKLYVLRAKSELAKVQQLYSSAKNSVEIQKTRLAHLLDLPDHDNVDFTGELRDFMPPMIVSFEECSDLALQNRPEIKLAQKEVAILGEDTKAAGSEFLPTVSANIQHIQNNVDYEEKRIKDTDREYYSMGITAQLNFFEGGRSYYRLQKNKQRRSRAMLQLQSIEQATRSEVKSNYLNMQESWRQIKLSKVYIEEAEETYQRALKGYQLGVNTSTDLVDATSELINAEVILNRSYADYLISTSLLLHSIGSMEKMLQISDLK